MMNQNNQKIKHNKAPMIILLSFAAAFIIGALLCFFIPKMVASKSDAPVELVNNKITMIYGGDGYYFLDGELKNVSEETITIKNKGGMEVSFSGTDIKFDDCWLLKPDLPENADLNNTSNYTDIVLEPGETYDFNDGTNCLNGTTSITRLLVTVNGQTYNLIRNNGAMTVLIVVFIIFALVFVVLAFTQNKSQRVIAERRNAALDACSANGEQGYLIRGNVADKDEKKRAAAKTAGWVFGAVISTLFTGRGVYRVYSGNSAIDFVLSENSLYAVNGNTEANAPAVTPVTRDDLTVSSIEIKKNKVIVKSADGKQTLTFFGGKKSPLSVEQIAEYLNNVFVKPVPQPEAEITDGATGEDVDPFADLAPEKAESAESVETIENADVAENTETDESVDGDKSDGE